MYEPSKLNIPEGSNIARENKEFERMGLRPPKSHPVGGFRSPKVPKLKTRPTGRR
jgi:hypothetical protein